MDKNLHSYCVVLNFATPGILIVGSYIAPDAASAGALAALEAAKKMRVLDELPPLINCLVVEESVEDLRYRLRLIEGGKPAGDVVSLVPTPNARGLPCPHDWTNGECAMCGAIRKYEPTMPPVA